jgi:hypothetical protein
MKTGAGARSRPTAYELGMPLNAEGFSVAASRRPRAGGGVHVAEVAPDRGQACVF